MKEEITWIPVSERLPENSRTVLIDYLGHFEEASYQYSKQSNRMHWWSSHSHEPQNVIAWAELPKGYTPEKNKCQGLGARIIKTFSAEEVRELIPDVEGQSGWGDLITSDSGPLIRDALLAFAELLEKLEPIDSALEKVTPTKEESE